MKFLKNALRLAATLLTLTACAPSDTPSTPKIAPGAPYSAAPAPGPIPAPGASPAPTCKALSSEWGTQTAPNNSLLGVYLGAPTNGATYTLKLTGWAPGAFVQSFPHDAAHSCTYEVSLGASSYTVMTFVGCNPGVIPPGGSANDQCNYCPGAADVGAPTLNWTFSYVQSCNGLTITDLTHNQTLTYH